MMFSCCDIDSSGGIDSCGIDSCGTDNCGGIDSCGCINSCGVVLMFCDLQSTLSLPVTATVRQTQ